ncbi:MAG: hypothetical protein ACRDKX_08285 [Solirubrobacterales bacterium]
MSPIPIRTLLAVCALALPIPAAVAGCGDDESSDEDPQTVLDETLHNEESLSSGNLSVTASATAAGKQGGSVEASLSGPFQGDPEDTAAIPQLDLTASASGEVGGESLDFDVGFTITDDNVYYEIGGQAYELGSERFARLRDRLEAETDSAESAEQSAASLEELCTRALGDGGAGAAACEIDVSSWLTNLTNEGIEEVGGAEATHLSGDADPERILTDVGEFVGALAGGILQGFDPAALGTFSDLVTEAPVDVFSGVDDRLLRGLDANLVIDPSALGIPVAIGAIEADLSLEIADVNEEQTIEPPADALPLEDLGRGLLDELVVPIPGAGGKEK